MIFICKDTDHVNNIFRIGLQLAVHRHHLADPWSKLPHLLYVLLKKNPFYVWMIALQTMWSHMKQWRKIKANWVTGKILKHLQA